MAETTALPDLLRLAGATTTTRAGRPVPAHFGSAPGELSICLREVGLALRSELDVMTLAGAARGLDELLNRLLGNRIAPGGVLLDSGAWWCRPAGEEVLVVCRHDRGQRLAASLRQELGRSTSATLIEHGEASVVIGLAGRHLPRVLTSLQIPCDAAPVLRNAIAAHSATWILQSTTSAFVVTPAASAAAVWQAIDEAGHDHGISCVGIEALERYALLERAAGRQTLV